MDRQVDTSTMLKGKQKSCNDLRMITQAQCNVEAALSFTLLGKKTEVEEDLSLSVLGQLSKVLSITSASTVVSYKTLKPRLG